MATAAIRHALLDLSLLKLCLRWSGALLLMAPCARSLRKLWRPRFMSSEKGKLTHYILVLVLSLFKIKRTTVFRSKIFLFDALFWVLIHGRCACCVPSGPWAVLLSLAIINGSFMVLPIVTGSHPRYLR
jgi:hypothetical protein